MDVGASGIFEIGVTPVFNVYRKHPVSIAVHMALLAAAATAAMAADRADAPADSAGAQGPAKPASTPDTRDVEESTVTVYGVRQSQIKAIEVKRLAPSIQDSISAESIGQLPDVTITDALQRITGVQINRDAGVGSSVDVRGLPQVGTMLNGESFITPDQVDSQQPDFTTLPATLFNQVDVIKSPTAAQTLGGISGSIDLHTFRPWDLPHGFTYSYSADGERGSHSKKTGPEANGLISYNADGAWGLQVSGDFSDTTRSGTSGGANAGGNSSEGLDQYGVIFHGENAQSAAAYNGFLGAWNGAPIPSKIVQNPDGSVDVNGDGKSNAVFMGSQNIGIYDSDIQRKRQAANVSFQADLSHGLTLTSDYFYAHQNQWDRAVGIQFNSTNWQGATYVPVQSRDTGATALSQYNTPPQDADTAAAWGGSHIYTTQVYQKYPGDVESFSQVIRRQSTAQNFNLQLDFDNGGPFTAGVRGIRETAKQQYLETDVNISDSDGCLWADPNTALPCGTFVYPTELGGNRVFNATGIAQNTQPIIADFRGRNLTISMPATLSGAFANPNAWTMKTLESNEDYNRNTALTALRFDGHYKFDNGIRLNFGIRNSIRSAGNDGFTLVTPVYAGMGASDPGGCLVRYVASDVILSGNATDTTPSTWCTAGNADGSFRAGPLSSQAVLKTPAPLAGNFQKYNNLLGSGITFWAVNPRAMDDPMAYWKSLYPNTTTQASPAFTWHVGLRELATYLQADFSGKLGSMSYSGNVGARVIHTALNVTQHLTGAPGQYGTEAADAGLDVTDRSYNDVLPALNFALNVTDKMTVRFSASKNMMPLNLSQWGGGLQLNYSLQETKTGPIYQVATGQSAGNPNLNPWRSTNYGASVEYYINPTSMINLELFRIDVKSFIINGAVTNCDLPDEDGVVRHHCIAITQPLQGTGNKIQGAEFDYRQGFTFLPGLLANTGMEFNFTYAPSKTGERDLAGNEIPFQDNSTESGNFILWYQDKRFEVRMAYNYRSKRAFQDSVGGIQGLEEYEAPQKYLDASAAYRLTKYAQVFVNATNLTNEYQRYYLVWPDQVGHSTFSERMFTFGLRGQW
ncbi:MAG: TonB-dependent receptor [Proteobacteria bacterium]|nr:TonB-dependent receptor [Pseudomonadota bacterium]